MKLEPNRGEVWLADLDPVIGREQAGVRPVLVVSANLFNQGPGGMVFVIPLTRKDRGVSLHVAIHPPEGGLKHTSFALCDKMRSVSVLRLMAKPWGRVSQQTLIEVEERLTALLEL